MGSRWICYTCLITKNFFWPGWGEGVEVEAADLPTLAVRWLFLCLPSQLLLPLFSLFFLCGQTSSQLCFWSPLCRLDGFMVLLQKIFSQDSRCMLVDGGQSIAFQSAQLSRDLLQSTCLTVWIKCFGGLWVLLRFFSVVTVPYGMAMVDGWNGSRDLLMSTLLFTPSHPFHFLHTVHCQQFAFWPGSSLFPRY